VPICLVAWARLSEYSFVRRGLNAWHGEHQSALKYRPITVRPFNTELVRREDTDGGRNKTNPVGGTRSHVEYPCVSCTARWEPSCCSHWLDGCEGREGWGDGPGSPGVLTGLPCQAPAAAFIVANTPSKTLTIVACRLVATVQTSCLYWQPGHLPNKPKLRQAPSRPTLIWLRRTLPHSHSSTADMPG
jgi:hypothetical protein